MKSGSENRLARHLDVILGSARTVKGTGVGSRRMSSGSRLALHLDTILSSMKQSPESLGNSGVISQGDSSKRRLARLLDAVRTR
jgi:hypothetical protein